MRRHRSRRWHILALMPAGCGPGSRRRCRPPRPGSSRSARPPPAGCARSQSRIADADDQPDQRHVRGPLEDAGRRRVDRAVQGRAEHDRADQRHDDVDQRVPAPRVAGAVEEHDAADAQHDVDDDDQQRAGRGPEVVVAERLRRTRCRTTGTRPAAPSRSRARPRDRRVDRRLEPGWVWPNAAGSTPSRPIANSVRDAAVAQATHTMKADSMPPISTSVPSQEPTNVIAVVFSATGSAAELRPVVDAVADRDRVGRPQVEDDRRTGWPRSPRSGCSGAGWRSPRRSRPRSRSRCRR